MAATGARSGAADCRYGEFQGDPLADEHAAALDQRAPGDVPVRAVDRGLPRDRDAARFRGGQLTSAVTGFVTPRMVRPPLIRNVVAVCWATVARVAMIVGWLAASRNLVLTCWSRLLLSVVTLVAPIVSVTSEFDRSSPARQLARRGRRRVRGARMPQRDVGRQRAAVDAFLAAARRGELAGLVAVLDPEVVLHVDGGATHSAATGVTRGATGVAGQAAMFDRSGTVTRPILVNGAAGLLVVVAGEPFAIMGFTVSGDRIVRIDIMADADRLGRLVTGLD